MEKTSLTKLAQAAANLLKNGGLKNVADAAAPLEAIRQALGLDNQEQALMLVAILDRQCEQRETDIDDLSSYFGCSALEVMQYAPALLALEAKGATECTQDEDTPLAKRSYQLREEVFADIVEGREVKLLPPDKNNAFDQFGFCAKASGLIQRRSQGNLSTQKLFSRIQAMEEEHTDLELVKSLQAMLPDIADRTLFYEMVNDFTQNGDGGSTTINSTLADIFDQVATRARQKVSLLDGTHPLMGTDLIEAEDKDRLRLTDEAVGMLFGENAIAYRSGTCGLDRYGFLAQVREYINELPGEVGTLESISFTRKVEKLERKNKQLSAVVNLRRMINTSRDRAIFYAICNETKDGDSFSFHQLSNFMPDHQAIREAREFKDQRHSLQKHQLVETCEGGLFDSAGLKLTTKGIELYFEEDACLFEKQTNTKQLMNHEKVTPKRLFFEPNLQRQLSMLTESLREEHYARLRDKLQEKGLPTGVAALLYGLPGTGKTESVWQLARETGRDILHVDISATKTCWFGESEKLIKEVFDNYRRLSERAKLKPILFFNEADAVFSKRKDANSSNVAQTENAIQNIILEEMERLDGILIATTNMADNLDKAFERRFLFKIHFSKPSPEAKANIWLDKLPTLQEAEARQLASRFDLSGGEIDNVVRKATMEEVLQGTLPTLSHLITLCEEERIEKGGQGIGFCK